MQVKAECGDERRQSTIMFCDMAGSSALSTQRDPEFWTRRPRPAAIANSLSSEELSR